MDGKKKDERINLVGRKVQMGGEVWFMNPKLIFTGAITKREMYRGRGRGRKMVDGYEVRWCDGERENWPYESLLPHLIPVPGEAGSTSTQFSRMRSATAGVKIADITNIGVLPDPERDEYEGSYMSASDDDNEQIVPSNTE